jgi:hypothetical protein
LNKANKIKLLKAIKERVIPTSYLDTPKTFIFIQIPGGVDSYKMNERRYTKKEYLLFNRNLEKKNRTLRNLGLLFQEDNIITLVIQRGKTIL